MLLTPEVRKKLSVKDILRWLEVMVVVEVKSVQIKPNIPTKIASQIAQNTNRPSACRLLSLSGKDIDKADMKNYKQNNACCFDNSEKCSSQ